MSTYAKPNLDPNPYKRSPIKKIEDLAGRARELKSIRYYLSLTAAGQSPHLALIGQRGVGKTSLLNGASNSAIDLKLLPVRLDMNEQKANSQWIFWQDFFTTIALSMAKAGCWGGEQGRIYADLLRMISSRHPGSLDTAVMQIPYLFSCHQGGLDTFECPDALVVNDLNACQTELKQRGYAGIALLIDEADCLGKNVPLLQKFRNIFQVVERCSLILAGTEGIFPVLSEVFSPIPRQFHRIDIKPFAKWSDTLDLVLTPLCEKAIAPKRTVIRELHQLCGGAPDEVQLYCHHMYRSVEDGSLKQMSLSPQVFREVLREYRSNSSANVDAVLSAIERLPDKLLFESAWLSRRALTLDENIRVTVLRLALKTGKELSEDEAAKVSDELKEGYRILFDSGIIEINNCIRLAGAPLSAGFWKSYVEVERGKRWSWDDDSFLEKLIKTCVGAIQKGCGAAAHIMIEKEDNAVDGLHALRAGLKVPDLSNSIAGMVLTALIARDVNSKNAVDVILQMDSIVGRHKFQVRFVEKTVGEISSEQIADWLVKYKDLFARYEIMISMQSLKRWILPTDEEIHRLGHISEVRIPSEFGPDPMRQAIDTFARGDILGAAKGFQRLLNDREDEGNLNNLGFCQILLGHIPEALENLKKAIIGNYDPLYELNKGVCEFLLGDGDGAIKSLKNALQKIEAPKSPFDPSKVIYVLILEPTDRKVWFYENIPMNAAILINLWRIGNIPREDLEIALTKIDPSKTLAWIKLFSEI